MLPLEAFNKNRSQPDGLHRDCKECKKEYQAEWYRSHAEEHKARAAKWKEDNFPAQKAWFASLKDGPCTDCGNFYDSVCMDWDHLPGQVKEYEPSNLVGLSKETILAEIAKCELVCANCHRIRTRDRLLDK